jgi:hypothetical protein
MAMKPAVPKKEAARHHGSRQHRLAWRNTGTRPLCPPGYLFDGQAQAGNLYRSETITLGDRVKTVDLPLSLNAWSIRLRPARQFDMITPLEAG